MDRETKNAVIYCRVSTKEQAEEGNSLVTQEKICREYAARQGFTVARIFIEQGESAKTANRTELQNLLSFCSIKKNAVDIVIAYKIDRISRNVDDYSNIRMMLKDYGITICSTSEQFDNKPAGRFMENILANVAQFDNDVRTERCVNGMKEAMRAGRFIWKAPFGYINGKSHGKANILPDKNKASVIRETFDLICQNNTDMESVRQIMITRGLTIKRAQFYYMLRNKAYCGIIERFGEVHEGSYEPLISKDTFNLVQLLLKNPGKKVIPYKTKNLDFVLRRFVSSPTGQKLTGSWSTGKSGKKFPYYRFLVKGSNYSRKQFENAFCDFMNSFAFDRDLLNRFMNAAKSAAESQNEILKAYNDRYGDIVRDLKEQQTALIQKNLKGIISDELLKEQLSIIQTTLTENAISEHSPQFTFTSKEIEKLFKLVDDFLISPGDTWKNADPALKLKLQVFEFPHGVVFDGQKFRTPYLSLVYKVKSDFSTTQSNMVHHPNKK
jgi:site-specific DNA recombinase